MKQRLKILHLIKSLGRGGAEMLLPETLALHNRERFDFEYAYFLPWKDQMVEALKSKEAKVTCFNKTGTAGMVLSIPGIAAYLRESKVDILHCHLPWAGIVGRYAGKLAGVPVVYTEHNSQERYHWATQKANLFTMAMDRETICVSADVRDSIRRFKGMNFPLSVVLNGINTNKFDKHLFPDRSILTQAGFPVSATVISTVAVFRQQKRLNLWVELAASLARQSPDVYFVVIGDGPLNHEIRARSAELGLDERIYFPGRLEEVRPWLAATDIYMMTSEFEGLPLALLEAMSMELPVISTDAGGIKEVVRDGIDGYIRPVSRTNELLEPLKALVNDKQLRTDMGRSGRQRVCSSFSIDVMVRELEGIYSKIGDEH